MKIFNNELSLCRACASNVTYYAVLLTLQYAGCVDTSCRRCEFKEIRVCVGGVTLRMYCVLFFSKAQSIYIIRRNLCKCSLLIAFLKLIFSNVWDLGFLLLILFFFLISISINGFAMKITRPLRYKFLDIFVFTKICRPLLKKMKIFHLQPITEKLLLRVLISLKIFHRQRFIKITFMINLRSFSKKMNKIQYLVEKIVAVR